MIRKRANETKVNARRLREEADQLNHRVRVTEVDIGKLEESSSKDDNLVDDAKRKVCKHEQLSKFYFFMSQLSN